MCVRVSRLPLLAVLAIAFLALLASFATPAMVRGQVAQAIIGPGQGVAFQQVDFLFEGAMLPDSDWGRISADPEELFSATGISRGYLNVHTDMGWVVANLLVDRSHGGEVATYFTLMPPGQEDVTALSAYVTFSTTPAEVFGDGARADFPVGAASWNGEGAGDMGTTSVGPPPPPFIILESPPDESHIQPNAVNVQTAKNQCFPMSIANSLQYLEDRFNVNVPHNHVMGLKGDASLVGQMDTLANRNAPSRDVGSGVWFVPMLEGKFEYLAANGLANALVHKHQGRGYGDPNLDQALKPGDFQHMGIVSQDMGAQVTWEWVCDEIKKGEDVELVFSYDDAAGNPTGGHAVRVFGCGITEGNHWLRYLHDATQTYMGAGGVLQGDDVGLETPDAYVSDMDGDGMLNFGSAGREVRFALSESQAPGVGGTVDFYGGATESMAWYWATGAGVAVLGLFVAGWVARKRLVRDR